MKAASPLLTCIVLFVLFSPLNADTIEHKLDQQAQLTFADITLEDAFADIENLLGIPLEINDMAMNQLPHGRLTRLSSVQIHGISWRDALTELLRPLALRYQTGTDRIYILGTDNLLRQPRRTSWAELNAIVALQRTFISDDDDHLLRKIRQLTGIPFGMIVNGVRQEKTDDDIVEKILFPQGQSCAHALDLYARALYAKQKISDPIVWYLETSSLAGKDKIDIVILPAAQLIDKKLHRHVDVEYHDKPVQHILTDLMQRAVIGLAFEPGALALVDENVRENCSLVVHGGSIRTALEAVSAITGLEYQYRGGYSLTFYPGQNLKTIAAARSASDARSPLACVLTFTWPDTDMQSMIFLREDELMEQGLLDKFNTLRDQQVGRFFNYIADQPDPEKSD